MKCENCDNPVAEQGKRFCSTTCWYAFTKKRRTIPCASCGELFERKVKSVKACSVACGNKLKEAKKEVVCATCGTTFLRPHGKQRTFCSRSCALVERNKQGNTAKASRAEGATNKTPNGYVMEKSNGAWTQQHRLVVEEKIGRKLLPSERVHHINGIRDDNRPENLELWLVKGNSKKDPAGQRQADLKEQFLSLFDESERAIIGDKFREIYKV